MSIPLHLFQLHNRTDLIMLSWITVQSRLQAKQEIGGNILLRYSGLFCCANALILFFPLLVLFGIRIQIYGIEFISFWHWYCRWCYDIKYSSHFSMEGQLVSCYCFKKCKTLINHSLRSCNVTGSAHHVLSKLSMNCVLYFVPQIGEIVC